MAGMQPPAPRTADNARSISGLPRRGFLRAAAWAGAGAGLARCARVFAQTPATGSPMAGGRPSATAHGAALLRAAHQILDEPRVFRDPLALRVITTASWTALLSAPQRFQGSRSLRAFVALRSRYAEDLLGQAVARGVRQYVVLGAGLDTFGCRNIHASSGLQVFEVDHPATQVWKRERLAAAGITVPHTLTFAPVDFETQTLADGLQRASFDAAQPAFFSLLGVVIYLSMPAVMRTLAYVRSMQPGSEIVFDYSVSSALLTDAQKAARATSAQRVAERGEPWITYFDPPTLQRDLTTLGFTQANDCSPQQANQRYFSGRTDELRVSSGRMMHVVV